VNVEEADAFAADSTALVRQEVDVERFGILWMADRLVHGCGALTPSLQGRDLQSGMRLGVVDACNLPGKPDFQFSNVIFASFSES